MAAQRPWANSLLAYVKLELDLSANPWNVTSPTYTDVTDDLRFDSRLVWERGRDPEWDAITAGTFGGELNNRTRSYDPASNSRIVGRRPARITCYYPTTSTAYVQFVGLVETFEPAYPGVGFDAVTAFEGVDSLTTLYLSKIVATPALQTTAPAPLAALANVAGIPVAQQSFWPGSYPLQGVTYENTDAASAMQLIVNSQVQMLFVSRAGVLTSVPAAGTSSSLATFGDGAGELDYVDLKGGVGGSGTYTVVSLEQSSKADQGSGQSIGPPAAVNVSTQDVAQFGRIVLDLRSASTNSLSAAATGWAARVATPGTYWFRELVIKPLADPANLFPVVLAGELGQRYTIVRRPIGGGSAITQTSVLRSIRHEVGGGDWVVTWGFTAK